MATLNDRLNEIVGDKKGLLNAAAKAVDKNGNVLFHGFAGRQNFTSDQALQPDAVYFIASCSKLVTSIAAMQCVEKGLLGLDDDVTKYLPELKDAPIISLSEPDFNIMTPEGQSRLASGDIPSVRTQPRKGVITLRHFLTNTSGFAYDLFESTSRVWRATRGETDLTNHCKMSNLFDQPCIFEPGTSWVYGLGFEWAGELVARLHKTSLEEYLQEHIFKPLGCTSTTFRPWNHPELQPREVEMAVRTPDGLVPTGSILPRPAPDDMGGIGLYSTVSDYVAILGDLISDNPKILKASTADEFFKPQLQTGSGAWEGLMNNKYVWAPLTGIPPNAGEEELKKVDFGLSGVLITEDTPSLPAGTLSWWGMPNLTWFANKRLGVAGLFATQLLPPGDDVPIDISREFREHVFAKTTEAS